jgi:hypothetical protein
VSGSVSQHKKTKRRQSKVHGLMAHYVQKLQKDNAEEQAAAQAQMATAPSRSGKQSKDLETVDAWVQLKRKSISVNRSAAMSRWKMATGGGPFQGR